MQDASTPTADPLAADAPAVVVQARFAQIPEALLYDGTVAAEAVRVYGVLHRYGSQPGNCYPSYATIAGHIGRSERSIAGWVRELEAAGWVRRVARWRNGDRVSATPPDGETGWEPTSNGYYVYAAPDRAGERGVRAGERAPSPPTERAPSAPHRAPNESHLSESHLERENTVSLSLVGMDTAPRFDEFWDLYPRRHGRKVGRTTCERQWEKLTDPQRVEAMTCLVHYAAECNAGVTLAKDPERWLRPKVWIDWKDPAALTTVSSPRQARKAAATAAFVGDEQPTGRVAAAFFGHGQVGS